MCCECIELYPLSDPDERYEEWRWPRTRALNASVAKTLISLPKKRLARLRAEGLLMINTLDVVHGCIKDSTAKIVFTEGAGAGEPPAHRRHWVHCGFELMLNHWLITKSLIKSLGDADPYSDIRGQVFDHLAKSEILATALAYSLQRDLVGIVRQEVRFRRFREEDCYCASL